MTVLISLQFDLFSPRNPLLPLFGRLHSRPHSKHTVYFLCKQCYKRKVESVCFENSYLSRETKNVHSDPRGSWSHIWGIWCERGPTCWGWGQSLISTGSLWPLCWEHSLRRGSCLGNMSLIFRLLLVGCGGLASTRPAGISEERSWSLVMGNLRRVWGSPVEGLEPGPISLACPGPVVSSQCPMASGSGALPVRPVV